MFNNFLKILIIFNYFNIYLSYIMPICNIIDNNQNLDLKPNTITLKIPDQRICPICKLQINIKSIIPENCTIPIGCPYNKKTKYYLNNTFKG